MVSFRLPVAKQFSLLSNRRSAFAGTTVFRVARYARSNASNSPAGIGLPIR